MTKGELGVCSLSSLRAADDGPRQESVEGNQVTVPALVSPQVKQTIQGHVPRSQTHTTGKLGEITQWFPTDILTTG